MSGLTRRSERGSVMMLFPVAVMIVLLLGALVVDAAIVYLAQRHAHGVALDAANDATGAGLDGGAFRRGSIEVDARRAEAVAEESVAVSGDRRVELVAVDVADDGRVTVTVRYEVERLFGVAFGLADTTDTISVASVGRTADG